MDFDQAIKLDPLDASAFRNRGISGLYGAVEAEAVDGEDPTLKERAASLKNNRNHALQALDYVRTADTRPIRIEQADINNFLLLMREQIINGDVSARKAHLSAIVDAVIVSGQTIRIVGRDSAFLPAGKRESVVDGWTIVNELPNQVSVSKEEVDAVEQYFSAEFDKILGAKRSSGKP